MAAIAEYGRRLMLPLVTVGVAAYYVLVLSPLNRRAAQLEEPLETAWKKLANSLERTNVSSLDFAFITNQLAETRQALGVLAAAEKQTIARLEPATSLRTRLSSPFQLVEYEYARGHQADELERLAKAQQVALDPLALSGLPAHTADVSEPSLLWAALRMTADVAEAAARARVSAIHSLEAPIVLTNATTASTLSRWAELPIQIEFTAGASNAIRFLETLPLNPEEVKGAGLPEVSPEKLPLFIDRLVIKRQAPEQVDEVRVWLRAVGFVMRE